MLQQAAYTFYESDKRLIRVSQCPSLCRGPATARPFLTVAPRDGWRPRNPLPAGRNHAIFAVYLIRIQERAQNAKSQTCK